MTVYRGRPAGYTHWPGSLARRLLALPERITGIAAGLITVLAIGLGGGVSLGALGVLAVITWR